MQKSTKTILSGVLMLIILGLFAAFISHSSVRIGSVIVPSPRIADNSGISGNELEPDFIVTAEAIPNRYVLLHEVLGIDLCTLYQMEPDELRTLIEGNAEKLGVRVYVPARDKSGNYVSELVAGDKIFNALATVRAKTLSIGYPPVSGYPVGRSDGATQPQYGTFIYIEPVVCTTSTPQQ